MTEQWTVDTLLIHMVALIEAQEARFQATLEERELRYSQRFADTRTALEAALAAAEKAVVKAEVATEKRFEAVNEFRQMVNELVSGKIDRAEFLLAITNMTEKIEDSKERITRSEGKGAGKDALWAYIIGAVGLVAAFLAIATRF
jgi:multidrug efflux pump subunit AcrA (membrane-fusion protein)